MLAISLIQHAFYTLNELKFQNFNLIKLYKLNTKNRKNHLQNMPNYLSDKSYDENKHESFEDNKITIFYFKSDQHRI